MNRELLQKEATRQCARKTVRIVVKVGKERRVYRGTIKLVNIAEKSHYPTFRLTGACAEIKFLFRSLRERRHYCVVDGRTHTVERRDFTINSNPVLEVMRSIAESVAKQQEDKIFRRNYIALNLMHGGPLILR